eukprot:gnl/MRDRNA2_/MRDRNA2_28343_c0_seq1.p1 gnl/MRDRNA2_/MRDRNA2_28343_c0~~gnl/MRDRNA2_/MRDRNA2_28343_c0_seq1.p1  ORF type:complete len:671 (+),score=106.48 gnl/MRDRNA2_/MRDRNA2_28343_c0_seq1:121-2133(+)
MLMYEVADWGGAGCWGRLINQNYIRMAATSSIAWSLIWSAYPNLECFGNGLLYAFEPWSGHYEVKAPVWTTAHTTQFTEVGWEYLPVGEGTGELPEGGTFATLADPKTDNFSIILETLRGQCFYANGCFHTKEATRIQVVKLNVKTSHKSLAVWSTNRTHWFQRQVDAHPNADGFFEISIHPDSIMTITTIRTASSWRAQQDAGPDPVGLPSFLITAADRRDPPSSTFPLPYYESFDEYEDGQAPKFWSDQGGAFEIVSDDGPHPPGEPGDYSSRRHVLQQQVMRVPTAWHGHSPLPWTVLGGVNWTDLDADVYARLGQFGSAVDRGPASAMGNARHTGLCVRLARYHFFGGPKAVPEGYCLVVDNASQGPRWTLMAGAVQLSQGLLSDHTAKSVKEDGWLHLRVATHGARVEAWVDDLKVASLIDTSYPFGQVALQCGYHRCQFDDLNVKKLDAPPVKDTGHALVRRAELATFHYDKRTCDPPPNFAVKRNNYNGFVGFAFKPKREIEAVSLGRMAVSGGHPWALVHNVSLFEVGRPAALTSVIIPSVVVNQVGVEQTDDGWIWADFWHPLQLEAGKTYCLVSSELASGDMFYDKNVNLDVNPTDAEPMGAVYLDSAGWHHFPTPVSFGFGPLNLRLTEEKVKAAAVPVCGAGSFLGVLLLMMHSVICI